MFTPAISVEFRKALRFEMDASTWRAIMDDNPGELANEINGTYPEGKPLSTVPPNILAALPRLPDDVTFGCMNLSPRRRLQYDRSIRTRCCSISHQ
jgi:hypothetical protein